MNTIQLLDWVSACYSLKGPVTCQLIRSYTNDVYLVRTGDLRYILKIYGLNWRTAAEIQYEIDLLNHLFVGGARTGRAVAGNDHKTLRSVSTAEGEQYAVLYAYVPGVKPQPPFDPSLYRAFGRAVAQMHALSDDFVSPHPRPALDLRYVLDDPLRRVIPLISRRTEQIFLLDLATRVRDRLESLGINALDWGLIHGDATLDNVHRTADGEILLYDFDSGGPGWRAADLQGWAAGRADYQEVWKAFREGYSQIRRLKEADVLAAPYLTIAWDFWGIQIDLERRVLKQDEARVASYLRDQIDGLRDRERHLPVDT